ncbi:MAG: hypothetical protein JWO69_1505, partial [Thermoleophilia bacterium]|nr:hypothetical protein [Thermoleophilia bacterium]
GAALLDAGRDLLLPAPPLGATPAAPPAAQLGLRLGPGDAPDPSNSDDGPGTIPGGAWLPVGGLGPTRPGNDEGGGDLLDRLDALCSNLGMSRITLAALALAAPLATALVIVALDALLG